MDRELQRVDGNTAISRHAFKISVLAALEVNVEYKEVGMRLTIPAETTSTGGIGLFRKWVKFPGSAAVDESRVIFERVIRALWFLEIPIDGTEAHPTENQWPLPPRQSK